MKEIFMKVIERHKFHGFTVAEDSSRKLALKHMESLVLGILFFCSPFKAKSVRLLKIQSLHL